MTSMLQTESLIIHRNLIWKKKKMFPIIRSHNLTFKYENIEFKKLLIKYMSVQYTERLEHLWYFAFYFIFYLSLLLFYKIRRKYLCEESTFMISKSCVAKSWNFSFSFANKNLMEIEMLEIRTNAWKLQILSFFSSLILCLYIIATKDNNARALGK